MPQTDVVEQEQSTQHDQDDRSDRRRIAPSRSYVALLHVCIDIVANLIPEILRIVLPILLGSLARGRAVPGTNPATLGLPGSPAPGAPAVERPEVPVA